MERKDFLTMLGVGAGSIVIASCLGACGKDDNTNPSPDPDPTPGVKTEKTRVNDVANRPEFGNGGVGYIIKEGVIIAKNNSTYIALGSACTHASLSMTYNKINANFPCSGSAGDGHGSVFNLDGTVKTGLKL
ncbi:MAG: hypothetical protein WBP45_05480 [Daejeonella sp.]